MYLFGNFRSSCSTEESLGCREQSGEDAHADIAQHSCRNASGVTNYRTSYNRITLHAISEHQGEGRSRNQKATANKKTTERKRSPLPATYLFGNFRSSCSTEESLGSGKQNRGGNPRTHAAMHMTGRITVRAIAFQTCEFKKSRGGRSRRKKATANKKIDRKKGRP